MKDSTSAISAARQALQELRRTRALLALVQAENEQLRSRLGDAPDVKPWERDCSDTAA